MSIFGGFRRNKNIGEIVCPTIPVRQQPAVIDKTSWGCYPSKCKKRRCELCSKYLKETKTFKSLADKRTWEIRSDLHCRSKNVVYVIECVPCGKQYVGSTINFDERWHNHKYVMSNKKEKESGLGDHYSKVHHDNLDGIKVTLIDSCQDVKFLKEREDFWIVNLNTLHGEHGLNSRDEIKRKSRIPGRA